MDYSVAPARFVDDLRVLLEGERRQENLETKKAADKAKRGRRR
ncbi:hypothetical protein LCGC14_0816550 [marine sediment metagenome]|uniref:Uncharacterized protein n=1 Tax=marine sediment metagenome TaxID=412755 RepID=A0A0F9SSH1_9ZZZZ